MVQIQFQILEEAMDALRAAAKQKGITPNVLGRLILHEYFSPPDTESKSYTFTAKNWREVEEYVEAKQLGSVEVFIGFAMKQYMARYPLKKGQKEHTEKNIDNADANRKAVQSCGSMGK